MRLGLGIILRTGSFMPAQSPTLCLIHIPSATFLLQIYLGSLFHFGRNGASLILENRSAVSVNFGPSPSHASPVLYCSDVHPSPLRRWACPACTTQSALCAASVGRPWERKTPTHSSPVESSSGEGDVHTMNSHLTLLSPSLFLPLPSLPPSSLPHFPLIGLRHYHGIS